MKTSPQLIDFAAKLSEYLQGYKNLTVARGLPPLEEPDSISPERFFASLSTLYAGKTVRILLYVFEYGPQNKQILKIFLAGPEGVIAQEQANISPGELGTLSQEWKYALRIAEPISRQATALRGSFQVELLADARSADQVSTQLSGILLPESIRPELQRTEHLIIFPTQSIGTIPFSILPLNDGTLIDRCCISVASDVYDLFESVRKIRPTRRRKPYEFRRPLIIGNPAYPKGSDWTFADLPGAAAEARYIAELIGSPDGRLLLGNAATKNAVVSAAEKADLLFFGTHGISSSQNSLDNSYLVLSPDAEGDQASAYWTAREIQSMKLRADLAVLSACQSGLGVTHEAGIIGLARAFRLAGVDHVIMSLWNVNDDATQELMKGLFHELLERPHHAPAAALRAAQLALRESRPDPIDWAPFTTFGLP